jgi:hypothetical protein
LQLSLGGPTGQGTTITSAATCTEPNNKAIVQAKIASLFTLFMIQSSKRKNNSTLLNAGSTIVPLDYLPNQEDIPGIS